MVAKGEVRRKRAARRCRDVAEPPCSAIRVAPVRASRQNAAMSHDSTFPDSAESPERRSERALEALQYEERAGLGFRRRNRSAIGDPYQEPERYQVDREPTSGELWAGLIAGTGLVLGLAAIFYKPLLLGAIAAFLVIVGSVADGQAARIARWGFVTVLVGVTTGMLMSIFLTRAPLW